MADRELGFRRNAQGALTISGTPLGALLAPLIEASRIGTPAYVYDLDGLSAGARALEASFGTAPHLTAYAVKANTAGTVVRALAAAGTGADVVSGGELEVALGAGIAPRNIVMSGVGKTDAELDQAIGRDIFAVQVESVEEIERLAARARAAGKRARLGLRVKPGVLIDSHAHVATGHDQAKFGIARSELGAAWERVDAHPELVGVGVSAHVGSMLREVEPYLASARVVVDVVKTRLASGRALEYLDFGGGYGIDYGDAPAPAPPSFVSRSLALLAAEGLEKLRFVIEPGRSLVGAYGVLVARVVQTKQSEGRRWTMLDAGMNDLVRPALYGAKHRVELLDAAPAEPEWRVVGPVCESSDDFGAHPLGPSPSGLVAIRDAGAYGFVLASEYNGRALPAEVFVSGGAVTHVSASPGRDAWVKRRLEA
ncbi:MAG TPA: diaminopimelate decarboxylase [Polyangiaceae bacterium]|nr:diaminopimelate decarboxylase [Polyangiaceae bacterium]